MKRIIISLAAVLVLCASCINENHFDVLISYTLEHSGSASTPTEYTSYIKPVAEAYDKAFSSSGLEPMGSGYWVMRDQNSTSAAESRARKVAAEAHESLNGYSCPLDDLTAVVKVSAADRDDIVVVRYQYGTGRGSQD